MEVWDSWENPDIRIKRKGRDGMTEREFLDMVIQERIKLILERKTTPEEDSVFEKGEKAIEGLGEETKKRVQAFIDLLEDLDAEREEQAYMGGFYDGVRLMTKIAQIGKEDRYGIRGGHL